MNHGRVHALSAKKKENPLTISMPILINNPLEEHILTENANIVAEVLTNPNTLVIIDGKLPPHISSVNIIYEIDVPIFVHITFIGPNDMYDYIQNLEQLIEYYGGSGTIKKLSLESIHSSYTTYNNHMIRAMYQVILWRN